MKYSETLSPRGNTFCYGADLAPWEANTEIDGVRSLLESALGKEKEGSASRRRWSGGKKQHWAEADIEW